MKKIALAFTLLVLCLSPVKAVAPVLAFVATTSAGTTAISSASTAVGLALSALAVLATATNPVRINFPRTNGLGTAPPTTGFFDPGTETASQLSGTCTVFIRVDEIYNGTSSAVGYDWTATTNTPCSNWPTYDNATFADSCSVKYSGSCAARVTRYKMRCQSTSCGLMSNGQAIESTDNAAVLAQAYSLLHSAPTQDNKINLSVDSGVISYDLNDPQLPASVGGDTGFPAPISGGGMALQYTNSTGQDTVVVQQPVPTGYEITEYNQLANGQVNVSTLAVSNTGTATSHSTASQPGYVNPVPSTAPATSVTYQPIVATNPNPGNDPGTDPGTGGEIQFPSDYARTGEAALAAQTVVDGLLAGELSTPEVADAEMPWFGATFDGVLPTINTSGATCPVWQFDALGESFYIDHHCQLIVDFNALFYAIFTAFWTLLAFRTVLEA